jgi:6,7-dimethyl-8-ribityllumazine synthase
MSTKLPTRPPKLHAVTAPRFAIVASEYNPDFVQALVNNTCKELYQIDENSQIDLFGAPLNHRCDVIIALGLIMQGKTKHAEFIAQSVSHALQQIALKHSLPVIHEVLLVADEKEARERCIDKELNRGLEAARAAFAMLRVKEKFKNKSQPR